MALAGGRPWDRNSFTRQQERGGLGYNDYRNLDPGVTVLFHPPFVPGIREGLLSPRPSDLDWDPVVIEISKGLKLGKVKAEVKVEGEGEEKAEVKAEVEG
jgi:hypothetical protein